MHTVIELPGYIKAAGAIFTEQEMLNVVSAISADPEAGDLIPGTGGCRKRRLGRAGMGKRGGARVVYYFGGSTLPVLLITAYAKASTENLTRAEQNILEKLVKQFARQYGGSDE